MRLVNQELSAGVLFCGQNLSHFAAIYAGLVHARAPF